jgi:hypothetical protein
MGASKPVSRRLREFCIKIAWLTGHAVWSAIIDVALALLPWKILWNLQMRFAEKIGVGVAMSLGLL